MGASAERVRQDRRFSVDVSAVSHEVSPRPWSSWVTRGPEPPSSGRGPMR
jgi:hypothetical protein